VDTSSVDNSSAAQQVAGSTPPDEGSAVAVVLTDGGRAWPARVDQTPTEVPAAGDGVRSRA
jgi:hypothetical protein